MGRGMDRRLYRLERTFNECAVLGTPGPAPLPPRLAQALGLSSVGAGLTPSPIPPTPPLDSGIVRMLMGGPTFER